MNDPTEYVWIVSWDKHQDSLRKRGKPWSPPWIKLSVGLLDDPAFNGLPELTQLLFLKLLVLFSRSRQTLPKHTRNLSNQLGQRVTKLQLERLNHAGLIDFCSRTVLEQRKAAFWNCSNLDKTAADQDLDQDLKDLETGEDSAADEEDIDPAPIGESELRQIVSSLPGADCRSLDVVEPLARAIPRTSFMEIVGRVQGRKSARNPVGLLVSLLESTLRDRQVFLVPSPRDHEVIPLRPRLEVALGTVASIAASDRRPWVEARDELLRHFADVSPDELKAAYEAALAGAA